VNCAVYAVLGHISLRRPLAHERVQRLCISCPGQSLRLHVPDVLQMMPCKDHLLLLVAKMHLQRWRIEVKKTLLGQALLSISQQPHPTAAIHHNSVTGIDRVSDGKSAEAWNHLFYY
jgi:hypothetical protein